jgi:hypothetical protein
MMSLLPPNYPIGKIPPQVIKAAMANELPDFSLLPDDLQLYIRNNIDKFARQQTNIVCPILA